MLSEGISMDDLEREFGEKLKNAKRLVILAVGNEIRKDDGVGPSIVKALSNRLKPHVKLIDSGTVPESFTSVIRRFKPTHILIIDAAGMGSTPGHMEFIDSSNIIGYSFSTHQMPLSLLIEFLREEMPVKIYLLGIQPESNDFGEGLSPKVKEARDKVVSVILKFFGKE